MLVNYGIEALKWKILIARFYKINYLLALKNVFTGQAFAFSTINNIGDFVGRVLHLKKDKLKLAALNIYTSYSQVFTITFFGCVAYCINFSLIQSSIAIPYILNCIILIALLTSVCIALYFYYQLNNLTSLLKNKPFFNKLTATLEMVDKVEKPVLTKLLVYSFLRYVTMLVQYFLVLQVFGINGTVMEVLTMIALLLISITIIPTIAFAELGIRGKLALVFFGMISNNYASIIISAITIWLINRVIPAIIGTFLTATIKYKQT